MKALWAVAPNSGSYLVVDPQSISPTETNPNVAKEKHWEDCACFT
jgi:hypothetical protein